MPFSLISSKARVVLGKILKKSSKIQPKKQNKVDWTKAWSTKYPILKQYQKEVDIQKYQKEISRLLKELQDTYHYNELDAMLVLKDILAQPYFKKKEKK